jgi:hypothetical protein
VDIFHWEPVDHCHKSTSHTNYDNLDQYEFSVFAATHDFNFIYNVDFLVYFHNHFVSDFQHHVNFNVNFHEYYDNDDYRLCCSNQLHASSDLASQCYGRAALDGHVRRVRPIH